MTTCTLTQYLVLPAEQIIQTTVYLELQGRGAFLQIDLEQAALGESFDDDEVAAAAADILGLPIIVAS